jgi:L-asparaginase
MTAHRCTRADGPSTLMHLDAVPFERAADVAPRQLGKSVPASLPRIAVIALGGTIASVPGSDGRDAAPTLSADALLASVPLAATVADIDCTTFRQYPSGDLTIADIVELADEIELRSEDVDGVVITQGTDTLEETSFLLDLISTVDHIPIVLTGAMRNAGLPGADGPANVLAALKVAASSEARGLGPLVVFADEIHLPRFVRKVHSSAVMAFASPNSGPIGRVTEERVRIPLVPRRRTSRFERGRLSDPLPRVAIARLGLGTDAAVIESYDVGQLHGVIVEVFGGGHVPKDIADALSALNSRVPVVFATRTGAGELYESTYAFPGSERDLLERGLISAGVLDGLKARLLLTLLLATGADRSGIQERFAEASS